MDLDISLIVAFDKNFAIGKGGKIPWNIPEELAEFKKITSGHVVVMGRKTWESIGCRSLPNRVNIVLTSTLMTDQAGVTFVRSEFEAIELLRTEYSKRSIFIIGVPAWAVTSPAIS